MKSIDEIKKHRQMAALIKNAKDNSATAVIEVNDQVVKLKVTGSKKTKELFLRDYKSWAKDARPPRGEGEDTLIFIWERAFFEGPTVAPTKPEGSIPDADVLAMIPKVPIDSQKNLGDVCRMLVGGLDRAYPGVGLNETGFGLGKKKLVVVILETLFAEGRISRSVKDAPRIVVLNLIQHLQIEKGGAVIGDIPLHVATASSP